MNEIISLSSTLHMFIFSDYYSYEPNSTDSSKYGLAPSLKIQATIKHQASWSFIGHFLAIIIFNLAMVLFAKFLIICKILKKACQKIRKYCCEKKKIEKNCKSSGDDKKQVEVAEQKEVIIVEKFLTSEPDNKRKMKNNRR